MTKTIFSIFMVVSFLAVLPVYATDNNAIIAEAVERRDYKKAIAIKQDEITSQSGQAKGAALKELAYLYLKDQDQEKAFSTFLLALDLAPKLRKECPEDSEIYKKAFQIYLDPSNGSPQVTAQKLLSELNPVIDKEPDQIILQYFIAIAYANLNRFVEFFDHFYQAYTYYPDHYLAYKTQAVLHIKLLERTRGEEDRDKQKRMILKQLEEALKREPRDVAIYRLSISFSPKEEKEEQVRRSLNKIIRDNIMVPRSDLMFYVQEALDSDESDLAARFIQKAREWYPESRLVNEAQTYLDAHK